MKTKKQIRNTKKKFLMSFCDSNVNSLQGKDVNSSRDKAVDESKHEDGFRLQAPSVFAACNELLTDPFNTFCLIPPDTTISMNNNMCSTVITQTDHPDAIFEKLVRGAITHPDDLPSIWESALLSTIGPTNQWISVQGDATHVPIGLQGDYLGLNTLPNFFDMSVANNCVCLHAAKDGILYEAQSDGFVRAVTMLDEEKEEVVVKGANNGAQSVLVSSSGVVRFALFSDKLYFFVNQKWALHPNPTPTTRYCKMIMFEFNNRINVAVFTKDDPQETGKFQQWILNIYLFENTVSNNPVLSPFATFGQTGAELTDYVLAFLNLVPQSEFFNARILLCATANFNSFTPFAPPIFIHMFVFDNNGFHTPQYDFWILQNEGESPNVAPTTNTFVQMGSYSTQTDLEHIIMRTSMWDTITATFTLNTQTGGLATDIQVRLARIFLAESLNQTRRLYILNDFVTNFLRDDIPGTVLVTSGLNINDLDVANLYVFAISPDGNDVWIFRSGILYRLHNPDPITWGTVWTTEFNLYNPALAKCSDYGEPDTLDPHIYNPGNSNWYLGTKTSGTPISLITVLPTECVRSPHETFRLVATAITNPTANNFAFVTCTLQRANEYALCATGNRALLFDDSNVQVLDAKDNVMWESHTHDRSNTSPDGAIFSILVPPFAVSSNNGLYLLYVTHALRLRLVFNGFNNERFAQWTSINEEQLGRAIDMQSNFCWNALKIPDPESAAFVDTRCACIGGSRLFHILVPQADTLPSSMLAPLSQNLPCIAKDCDTGTSSQDNNVVRYQQQRCGNRTFVICNQALDLVNVKLINGGILISQQCLVNQQDACVDDSQCNAGFVCNNGKCITSCENDAQCQQIYGDVQIHRCVQGKCFQSVAPQNNPTPLIVYIGIVVAVILLILILLFFGLLGKSKKEKK